MIIFNQELKYQIRSTEFYSIISFEIIRDYRSSRLETSRSSIDSRRWISSNKWRIKKKNVLELSRLTKARSNDAKPIITCDSNRTSSEIPSRFVDPFSSRRVLISPRGAFKTKWPLESRGAHRFYGNSRTIFMKRSYSLIRLGYDWKGGLFCSENGKFTGKLVSRQSTSITRSWRNKIIPACLLMNCESCRINVLKRFDILKLF